MIGFYLHHHGAGHRIRGTLIARQLGERVIGFGTGSQPAGWPGEWVRLDPDDIAVDRQRDDITARGVLHWSPLRNPGLLRRHAQIVTRLDRVRPRIMVVDVSVEVTLLCRLLGIPVVVMMQPGERSDPVHRLAYDVAEILLAPWPAGVHGANFSGSPHIRSKTIYLGGISQFEGRDPEASAGVSRGRVLLICGSGGTRIGSDYLDAARRATPGWDWVVRGGPALPVAADQLWRDLAEAEIVVSHAGQNAVADVAAARKPAVVVAQPRPFAEQVATTAAVTSLGVAIGLSDWPEPERWPDLLVEARTLGGENWRRWAGAGAAGAAELLRRLSVRGQEGTRWNQASLS